MADWTPPPQWDGVARKWPTVRTDAFRWDSDDTTEAWSKRISAELTRWGNEVNKMNSGKAVDV